MVDLRSTQVSHYIPDNKVLVTSKGKTTKTTRAILETCGKCKKMLVRTNTLYGNQEETVFLCNAATRHKYENYNEIKQGHRKEKGTFYDSNGRSSPNPYPECNEVLPKRGNCPAQDKRGTLAQWKFKRETKAKYGIVIK